MRRGRLLAAAEILNGGYAWFLATDGRRRNSGELQRVIAVTRAVGKVVFCVVARMVMVLNGRLMRRAEGGKGLYPKTRSCSERENTPGPFFSP